MAYSLDRLGWLHFEQLCAALFELEGGIAPLAWAGGADRSRGVLSGTALGPPLVKSTLRAPVLVQCAWVRERSRRGLTDALRAFVAAREEDIGLAASFVLVTNLNVGSELRQAVKRDLSGGRIRVAVLGRRELEARLDARAELRRVFPSVLGGGDLGDLIDAGTRSRSSLDVEGAQELAESFVPTRAYRRTLGVLDAHRFAVLTGPPEMGKTAIAQMIALAQMTAGWEGHECVRPDDLWRAFDPGRAQVFVADDAFGSTEYRPDSAERWAREMERILRALDDSHWLIWTSRPAPLRAGLRRLHRERGAERFPSPGEVLVDASALDVAEKTLILFRHAKAAELPARTREALKTRGVEIVVHPHFTPERIRRLVSRLKTVPDLGPGLARLAGAELSNPTEAMAASFRGLGSEHRDLLIAMLDTPPGPVTERDLVAALRRHHDGGLPHPPAELVDRLADHFLRVEQ